MKRRNVAGEERRDALYRYLLAFKIAHGGASPGVRELADAVDTVPSVIHFHLRKMEADGRIRLVYGGRKVRHIAVPGEQWIAPGGGHGTGND